MADEGARIVVWARTLQEAAVCPVYGASSERVHGYQLRTVADVPAAGGDFGAPAGSSAVGPPWDRVAGAAQVLRGELERPGGYHRGRARGVIERLTGVTLGRRRRRHWTWGGTVS